MLAAERAASIAGNWTIKLYVSCVMPARPLYQYHSNLFSSGLDGERRRVGNIMMALLAFVGLRLDPYARGRS